MKKKNVLTAEEKKTKNADNIAKINSKITNGEKLSFLEKNILTIHNKKNKK